MTAVLTFLQKYRKYLIPAAVLGFALFTWLVIRKMTLSDNPLATSGWLYWAGGAVLVFIGCTCKNRNLRFGLAAAGILLLYPGLFLRNHYDGFIYAWLGLIVLIIVGIFWVRGRKIPFVILCNLLPIVIFLAGVVGWSNLEYFGRTAKSSEYPCRQDPLLGYVHVENRKIHTVLYHYWKKVLDSHMTLDSRGRRITPDNPAGQEIIFIGCSFTEGALLSDQETLPYRIGELSGRKVLNLGVSGYGIHQFQRMLELNEPWDRQVPRGDPAHIIYLGMAGHVSRIVNSGLPAYELKAGRSVFVNKKTTEQNSMFDFIKNGFRQNFLGILLLARLSNQKPSMQDIQLYTASISQCADMLKKKYPNSRFSVLFHDSLQDASEETVLQILEKQHIPVIRVSSLLKKPLSDPIYKIPYDGHPSAQCWKEAAPKLWKILSAGQPKKE